MFGVGSLNDCDGVWSLRGGVSFSRRGGRRPERLTLSGQQCKMSVLDKSVKECESASHRDQLASRNRRARVGVGDHGDRPREHRRRDGTKPRAGAGETYICYSCRKRATRRKFVKRKKNERTFPKILTRIVKRPSQRGGLGHRRGGKS